MQNKILTENSLSVYLMLLFEFFSVITLPEKEHS